MACADTVSDLDATPLVKDGSTGTDATEGSPDAEPEEDASVDAGGEDALADDATEGEDGGGDDASELDANACDDTDGDQHGPGCALGDDCDPNDPSVYETVMVSIDIDGDLATVGAPIELCTDGTIPAGYAPTGPIDCDDTRADVRPGLAEQPDCIDHDCDGSRVPFG